MGGLNKDVCRRIYSFNLSLPFPPAGNGLWLKGPIVFGNYIPPLRDVAAVTIVITIGPITCLRSDLSHQNVAPQTPVSNRRAWVCAASRYDADDCVSSPVYYPHPKCVTSSLNNRIPRGRAVNTSSPQNGRRGRGPGAKTHVRIIKDEYYYCGAGARCPAAADRRLRAIVRLCRLSGHEANVDGLVSDHFNLPSREFAIESYYAANHIMRAAIVQCGTIVREINSNELILDPTNKQTQSETCSIHSRAAPVK
ncbi:hypothetical protein EVAR_39443_1 [Eumeta japonica]|uniref:Uncharacterized protein n=1 Tax=Eumeta variegata TaxID=151549 RepID=A0A4C1W2Y6_EUMVA|nr:hypothetical protein EVAR_39443_1 [Eumeta japonica]